ncbi:chemotaxis protein CheD [soil metagenome]
MSQREIIVRVADLQVGGAGDLLVTIGLGSCIAIVLHDPGACVGGLAHVLLPSPALSRQDGNLAKSPHTAIPRLLQLMCARGANPRRVTGRLAGGASMFAALAPPGTIQMGERNVVASREVLSAHGIPVVGEAVGGDFGRTVRLDVSAGRLEIRSVAHGIHTI